VGLSDVSGSEVSLDIAAGDVGVIGGGVDTGDGNGGSNGVGTDVISASCGLAWPLDMVKSKPVSLVWFCIACRCLGHC
jgi:hypothetical protein